MLILLSCGTRTQVVYFINATMVNNLLLRKDLCHWTTGIQIRKNLSCIEDWTLQRQMKDLKAILVQATQISQLLQVYIAHLVC